MQVIRKEDTNTMYHIKYVDDGEKECVSGDMIRALSSMPENARGGKSEERKEPEMNDENLEVLEEFSQSEAISTQGHVPYKPKHSIGDDGTFVPALYEGT